MKVKSESEVAQSCPTLSDCMDCSPPGSPVPGILQARALEWAPLLCRLDLSFLEFHWNGVIPYESRLVCLPFLCHLQVTLITDVGDRERCGLWLLHTHPIRASRWLSIRLPCRSHRFDLWRQVRALGQGDPLEEGMATHPSILAWRTPWTEEPGGLQSIGLQRVGHDGRDVACARTHTHTHAHIPPLSAGPSFSLLFSTYIYLSFLRASPTHSRPWH